MKKQLKNLKKQTKAIIKYNTHITAVLMACYIMLCVLRNKQIKIMAKRKFKSKKSADSFAKRVKGKVNDCTMNNNTDANYTVVFKHIKQSKDISYGVGKSNVSQEYYT